MTTALQPALNRDVPRRSSLRTWLTGLGLVVLFSGISILLQRSNERELREMPVSDRRTLYEQTLQILRTSCATAASTPGYAQEDRCREQASFLARFPECDRTCHQLTDPLTPKAMH